MSKITTPISATLASDVHDFVKQQLADAQFHSERDMLESVLRARKIHLEQYALLEASLSEGVQAADAGNFVQGFAMEDVIARAKAAATDSDA